MKSTMQKHVRFIGQNKMAAGNSERLHGVLFLLGEGAHTMIASGCGPHEAASLTIDNFHPTMVSGRGPVRLQHRVSEKIASVCKQDQSNLMERNQ